MSTMDADLFLMIGSIISLLAFPALVGAFSESRPPRAAAILIMIGGGLIVLAVTQHPGGYAFQDVPDVFTRVIARFL